MTTLNPGFPIETLALPHEKGADLRGLLDEWYGAYQPRGPIERALVEQSVVCLIERRRLLRICATVQTEVIRTAELYWEEAQEDEVEKYKRLFNLNPHTATTGLKRSAAGLRFLISCWERLESRLTADGTWYGSDRLEAIELLGHSAMVEDLYFAEEAWMIWLDCLAAQPHPKQADIDLICRPTVVPKALQDRDVRLWRPDPAESRARLHALVVSELPSLRAREQTLRTQYEEPARAAAKELALARATKDEAPLLRALRSHERSFRQATSTLVKLRAPATEIAAWLVAAPTIDQGPKPEPGVPEPTPPNGIGTSDRRPHSPPGRRL